MKYSQKKKFFKKLSSAQVKLSLTENGGLQKIVHQPLLAADYRESF